MNTWIYFVQIYKIPLKTCEHYIRCSDCLTSDDPNECGWCGGKCTSREECGDGEGEGEGAMSGEGEESEGAVPEEDVDSEDDDEWVTDQCSPVIYDVSSGVSRIFLFCGCIGWGYKFLLLSIWFML